MLDTPVPTLDLAETHPTLRHLHVADAMHPAATVTTEDELAHAVELMVDRDVSHLVVLDAESHEPVGVLSTLDVAHTLAGAPDAA